MVLLISRLNTKTVTAKRKWRERKEDNPITTCLPPADHADEKLSWSGSRPDPCRAHHSFLYRLLHPLGMDAIDTVAISARCHPSPNTRSAPTSFATLGRETGCQTTPRHPSPPVLAAGTLADPASSLRHRCLVDSPMEGWSPLGPHEREVANLTHPRRKE